MELNRREALAIGLGLAFAGPAAAQPMPAEDPLDALARRGNRRFGSCVGGGTFADQRYRQLLIGQCGTLVPENELKWGRLRRRGPQDFNFSGFDPLIAFAGRHDMTMRGHTLLWHHPRWTPGWLATHDFGANPRAAAESMLRDHIARICTRYGRRIHSYDVVNEAVDNMTGTMRETPFSRAFGDSTAVVDHAFHVAREVAPAGTQLVYNDYMSWGPRGAPHRDGVLRLLEHFRSANVPVDALGIQAHIGGGDVDRVDNFASQDEAAWRRFVDAAVGMGFKLVITEFDCNDRNIQGDDDARDRAVADYARAYLDLMLSYPQMGDILAWGMTDRHSWLQGFSPRPDGRPLRCCPYDADYRPKPLREAIAAAFRTATPYAT
jgi:endo-1,4-beta-xylanase